MSNDLNQLTQTPLIQPGTSDKLNWPWVQYFNGLKLAGGASGVTSLNALVGALSLIAGPNITITPAGLNIQISATAAAATVLKGDSFTPDDTTQDWTLTATPSGIVMVFWNGLIRGFDQYSVVGTALKTVFTAATGDSLLAIYL